MRHPRLPNLILLLIALATITAGCATSSLPGQPTPQTTTAAATPPLEPTPTPIAPSPEQTTVPSPSPTDTPPPYPIVVAYRGVNVRSGPGANYQVIAGLRADDSARILASSTDSTWWQIELDADRKGWVFGQVITVLGDVAGIAVATDIPTPPPSPTALPTQPPEEAPAPAPAFRLIERRLWGAEENGGHFDGPSLHCGEKHELYVVVVDAAGNRLDGVTVGSIYIHDTQAGQDMVVFLAPGTASALDARSIASGRDVGATGVFDPTVDGQVLTFQRQDKTFVDDQTGSTWNIVGQAIDGALDGAQLTPIVHADHFWFSWAAFRPDTVIYSAE
ncbi:MAG: DUF3179 domain-containing protein [Chloroflexi bacterium]|nr:DUF3179 domain-containing protein [Chloroflexota bacterium]